MKRYYSISQLTIYCFVLVLVLSMGCAARPFYRPAGKPVGSVKGKMQVDGLGRTTFVLDLYRDASGEYTAYFSLPYRGVRYQKVEEISFDNDVIHIETSPSGRDFNGKLTGDDLKFKGEWNQYSGMLKLKIKE